MAKQTENDRLRKRLRKREIDGKGNEMEERERETAINIARLQLIKFKFINWYRTGSIVNMTEIYMIGSM